MKYNVVQERSIKIFFRIIFPFSKFVLLTMQFKVTNTYENYICLENFLETFFYIVLKYPLNAPSFILGWTAGIGCCFFLYKSELHLKPFLFIGCFFFFFFNVRVRIALYISKACLHYAKFNLIYSQMRISVMPEEL